MNIPFPRSLLVLLASCQALAAGAPPPPSPSLLTLFRQAGQTESDGTRLQLLRQIAGRPELDAPLRAEFAALLPLADAWAAGNRDVSKSDSSRAAENGYLCRFLSKEIRPSGEGKVHPPEPRAGSPLHPIWAFYRARMLLWRVVQTGGLLRVEESRQAYYGEARRLLQEANQAFPGNRVIRMYLGEPIPWPRPFDPDPLAPAWANLQREGLEKLADVIHWWIAERQLPDGQFGGGWGDDVEMWRWWTPVLIGFEDPVINQAQERISLGMFRQPHMSAGFTSRVTDVEHGNEDTTDTILPMMHLHPEDPLWKGRALRLAGLMRDHWTGINQHGFRQFRSIYFSAAKVDTQPGRAFDTVYHAAAIQPALLAWQRTRDPDLTSLFGEWLRLWVDAANRESNGKPAGVLPSAIRWPDGLAGLPGQPWWEPFSLAHNDALYNWPGAIRLMTATLLLAWHVTGDETYLAPIHSMARFWQLHGGSKKGDPGSDAWCARQIAAFLPDVLSKYRALSGDPRYDALLLRQASGYAKYRLDSDPDSLLEQLRRNAEAFRSNWEAYTSEMRWTDRVMSFTGNYLQHLPEPPPPSPSAPILYSSVTGDPGSPLVFPLNAVRWLTPPRQMAALVTRSGPTEFTASLYHFGSQSRKLDATLYLLRPGRYQLRLTPAGDARATPIHQETIQVDNQHTRISISLPSRQLCDLSISAGAD